jgi:predicted RNA-binding Zn-ribbon protein involved in translation (DUF1610 family)
MATETTIAEHKFLVSAENDIVLNGKTEKKCPRCGNKIIIEDKGLSYCVRCASDNCIYAEFRGL